MSKKKKKKKDNNHPTLFAYDGSIRYYQDGSMLELYSKITEEEWEDIVEETVKYKVFVDCLKDIAYPALNEAWTQDDQYFKLMLDVALSRMKNIDALLVAKYNEKNIRTSYEKMMEEGVEEMKKLIKDVQEARNDTLKIISSNL